MALAKGNKVIVIHSGSESAPTTWTSQEFKGEGFSLPRPKGLIMACQLWRYEDRRHSGQHFLSNCCYAPSGSAKHTCFLWLGWGGGRCQAGGVPSAPSWISCCPGAEPEHSVCLEALSGSRCGTGGWCGASTGSWLWHLAKPRRAKMP